MCSDLIEGIYRLMMSEHCEPVNIGNPHEMTMLEFAREIIRATGSRSRIVYQAVAAGRSEAAAARHHARAQMAEVGTKGAAGRGVGENDRLFQDEGVSGEGKGRVKSAECRVEVGAS